MRVYRYNQKFADFLKCKVKAEPWLHVAIQTNPAKTQQKTGIYVVYVWDTRKVVAEGKIPQANWYNQTIGPGRGDGQFDYLTFARDNGKPLDGAKYEWNFDNDDMSIAPLKITKIGLVNTHKPYLEVFSADSKGGWHVKVGATINGHGVIFDTEARRFGLLKDGAQMVQDATVVVDGKNHKLFAEGQGNSGYYGSAISWHPKCTPVGKPQHFVGQKYKVTTYAKDCIAAFVRAANDNPEMFSLAFKKAIGCR